MTLVNLDSLDLAALLCSRVCHDVISPVGAIVNGLEVLAEEKDASMRDFALELINKSAKTASARLQFARIAFGAAGSAGSAIDTGDAEQVAKGFLNDDKLRLSWSGPRLLMPKNRVKLLLNLLVVAASCIPRGGSIDCVVEGDADYPTFTITASGKAARIPHGVEHSLAGTPESGTVDAHGIQPFYAGMVARASDMGVAMMAGDEHVKITSQRMSARVNAAA
ncbi:MAG: histidine phosphotransferase ChpT [Beijerinckiaceae bacterium]